MIFNIWDKTDLYCGNNHNEEIKMELTEKRGGLFYTCPFCSNSFSTKDVEKIFSKIEDVICKAARKNELIDIKNLTFKIDACNYKIIENSERIKIQGTNKRSLLK